MNYWLMKSEPDEFSIDDLVQNQCEMWDGVRNFQARNFMQSMKKGDLAFFYHSSCKVTGLAGIMKVAKGPYPDPYAVDPESAYFDPKSVDENRWTVVDMRFVEKFKHVLTLAKIKKLVDQHKALAELKLVKQSRLSVMPLTKAEWDCLLKYVDR